MMQFYEDNNQQKGLFTFYRQQAEQQEKLKKQKEVKNKNKLRVISQQKLIQPIIHKKQQPKIPFKKIIKKPQFYQSPDHSVIVVKSIDRRNNAKEVITQPIQNKIYDLQLNKLPSLQIFVHKSDYPFKNNHLPKERSFQYHKISIKDYMDQPKGYLQSIATHRQQTKIKHPKLHNSIRYQQQQYNPAIKLIAKLQSKLPSIEKKLDHQNYNYRNQSAIASYHSKDLIEYKSKTKLQQKISQHFKRNQSRKHNRLMKQDESKKFKIEKQRLIAIIKKIGNV